MHRQSTISRVVIFGASVLIGMWILTGVATAAPASGPRAKSDAARPHSGQSSHVTECSPTHHSDSGHGANTDAADNPYHNTCEQEHAPGNGKGDGSATGKPCAGCVGNADDKNPPGQAPGGSDHNAGYECDRNEGVGKENPAHTGCGSQPADTDEDEGDDNVVCPSGTAMVTSYSYVLNGTETTNDLTGDVEPGDHVKVSFTIAAGCTDKELSLVAYTAPSASVTRATADKLAVFDKDTGTFGAGTHVLEVDVPDCFFQVDFVTGAVIDHFGPADSNNFYSDQGRLIDNDNGGNAACVSVSSSGSTGSDSDNGVASSSSQNSNTPNPSDTVLGSAASATVGASNVIPANVDAAAIVAETPAASGVAASRTSERGRPAEVLGVAMERSASSELARTGIALIPAGSLGVLLCLVGFGLVAVRGRRDSTVSVADRLYGHGFAA